MKIENLQTPHPNHIKPDRPETPRPLLDAVDVDGLRTEFDRARGRDEAYYAQTVAETLPGALEHVRRSLWYKEEFGPNATTTTFDTLKQTGETNCFGYAHITSQLLGRLGVEHWMATVGKHATTILPLQLWGSEKLYMADGMNAEYTGFITGALQRATIATIRQEMNDSAHPRGVAMLNLGRLPYGFDRLGHGRPSVSIPGAIIAEYERTYPALVMSLFHVRIGERALRGTAAFHAAAAHGDHLRAAAALREIPGLYYNIDARASHQDIKIVVDSLCKNGNFDKAQQAATDYCASFARTRHPRLTELRADLLATIAESKGCIGTYHRSIATYEQAARSSKLGSAIRSIHAKRRTLEAIFSH